jgi:murein L,D-transpeptidase YcbB/YkuD
MTAFLMRTSALTGLLAGLRNPNVPVGDLWTQVERLIASDVLWETFVRLPIETELRREGSGALNVPSSAFLASADAVSPQALAQHLAGGTKPATAPRVTALLKLGSTGPQVSAWQKLPHDWLAKTHRPLTLPGSGIFDQATETATTQFQQAIGLTPDGVVGPLTQSAMRRALSHG